ncbi:TOBE domain-containing protein, partial [Paenibacillus sepulcri]|nr:TOBE domain-containing protein [Paenibacillus sepulcri]
KKLGTTFVYVTHDQVEAMSMADTIVLMNKGTIQQEAPPDVMYRQPNNLFTAQFIGVPPMNVGELGRGGVKFGFRPESAELTHEHSGLHYAARGRIITREMLGSETIYQVRCGQHAFMIKCVEDRFTVDQDVHLGVAADKLVFFEADGSRISTEHALFKDHLEALRGIPHGA